MQLYKTDQLAAPAAFALPEANRIVVFAWNANASCVEAALYSYASWFGAVAPITASAPIGGGAASLKSLESVAQVNSTTFVACDASGTAVTITVAGTAIGSSPARPFAGSWTRVFWIGPGGRSLRATSACALQLDNAGPCVVTTSASAVLDATAAILDNHGTVAVTWASGESKNVFLFVRKC